MDIWNLYIYVSWEMLIKGNSLSYRCPLHPEQSRWEQNWTCSPKPSSMNLSWTQTLLSLSALSLLLMAQCLSLFPTPFSFWCLCYWLLTAQSSCSMLADLLLGSLLALKSPFLKQPRCNLIFLDSAFSIFPWKHPALNQALPPTACLDAVLEHGRSPAR